MDRHLIEAGLSSLALAVALLGIEFLRDGAGPEIAAVASVGIAAAVVLGAELVDDLVGGIDP
jgi:hypothetical protein